MSSIPGAKENLPSSSLPIVSIRKTKRAVLEQLSKGGNAHSISRILRTPRSNVVEHLQSLARLGLAKKGESEAYGEVWVITESGRSYLEGRNNLAECGREGVGVTLKLHNEDRANNIKIKFPVLSKPKTEDLAGWTAQPMKNNVFYTKHFGEYFTTFTGLSLIIQLPPLRGKDPDIVLAEAGRLAMSLKEQYEKDIPNLKLGQHELKAQLISQHHALQNHPLSQIMQKAGVSYTDGIVAFDASSKCIKCGAGVPEIEFEDNEKSHLHVKEVIDFSRDIALNGTPTMTEISLKMKQLASSIMAVQETNKETASGLLTLTKFMESQLPKKTEQKIEPIKTEINKEVPSYFG